MKTKTHLIGRGLLVVMVMLFAACTADHKEPETLPKQVLLVYFGADNNLSDESYQKIDAITEGWDGDTNHRVLLYHDAHDAPARLAELKIVNGYKEFVTTNYVINQNSASKDGFANLLRYIQTAYPTSNYGLLMFSHASGWLPKGGLTQGASTRTIIIDGGDEMDVMDLAEAIPDQYFDYMVFEACFMSGIEVAYQLKDKTKLIFASSAEILSPGLTEVYPTAINLLFKQTIGLQQFAQQAFDYSNDQQAWRQSASYSVIQTSGLNKLADFVAQNADFGMATDRQAVQSFDRIKTHLFFDFTDYISRLLRTSEQKEQLSQMVSECVIWKAATPEFLLNYGGFKIVQHSGLTTYIPDNQLPLLNQAYRQLEWAQYTRIEL